MGGGGSIFEQKVGPKSGAVGSPDWLAGSLLGGAGALLDLLVMCWGCFGLPLGDVFLHQLGYSARR